MKRIVVMLIGMCVIAGVPWCGSADAKDMKIGYVDVFKVFNEYEKTKEYDAVLEKKKEEKEAQLQEKKEKIEQMQNKLSMMKEKEQGTQREKIAEAVKEFKSIERESFIDLKKTRDERMKEIVEDIDKVVEEFAQEEGYDLIVNGNAVLYGSGNLDITDQILKKVNQRYGR
ncbi:MAG: hypothetical protein GF333_05815 [Candidatus Omnitrophica bacterium]|nr:hypothetical protein [Candidatus Omnitrophota bacterium]